MKRTIIARFLLLCLLLSLLPVSAFALSGSAMTLTQNYTNGGQIRVLINGSDVSPGADGKYSIPADAMITLKATAAKDFAFDYWDIPQGYGVSETQQYQAEISFVNPGEDFTVRAMFRQYKSKYTVRLEANEYGMGNFGHKDFAPGEKVKIDATAYDGFRFVRWVDNNKALKNVGLSGNWEEKSAIEFIMPERDVDLSIEFDFIKYYFTVSIKGAGEVEVSGKQKNSQGKYECTYGEEILLSAVAAPDNVFVFWAGTGGAILSDFDKTDTTLTCPASDFTITANFSSSVRNLTVEATTGGITSPTGQRVVGVENIMELTAKPDEGYEFSHWECSSEKGKFADPKKAETDFTMPDEDCVVKAIFKKGLYEVVVNASAGGKTQGEVGFYEMGTKITAKATAFDGYVFSHWQCSEPGVVVSPDKKETDILVPGKDIEITAIFKLKSALSANPGNTTGAEGGGLILWITISVVFVISAVAIALVMIRERFNLSYRYLLVKGFKKLFGKE